MKRSNRLAGRAVRLTCACSVALLAGLMTASAAPLKAAPPGATTAQLSRQLAQRLIEKNAQFGSTTKVFGIDQAAFNRATADGIWEVQSGWWAPTSKGAAYFVSVNLAATTLRTPLHRAVTSVDGITEGYEPGEKVAEFTWHFVDLTEPIATYTGSKTGGHRGLAHFRRYDDGWRVTRVENGNGQDGDNDRPFASGAPPRGLNDREAATITLANIRALDAVWGCLLTVADLKDGYDFEGSGNAARHEIPVERLRTIGHSQGCWNIAGKDIPTDDGWGHPLQLAVWGGKHLEDRSRGFEIRSAGRDGIFERTTLPANARSSTYDADIVWIRSGTYAGEGTFVQRPISVPLPACPSNPDCFEPTLGKVK